MQAFICDVCQTQAQPESGYNHPLNWYSVHRLTRNKFTTEHVCSPICLLALSNRDQDVIERAERPAETTHV